MILDGKEHESVLIGEQAVWKNSAARSTFGSTLIFKSGSLRLRSCATSEPLAEIRGMRLVHDTEDRFAVGTYHHEHFYAIYATVPSAWRRNCAFTARTFHVDTS